MDGPDVSHIAGNAALATKRAISNPSKFCGNCRPDIVKKPIFAEGIFPRMKVVEVSIVPKPEEPKKVEAKVVVEVDVAEDMLNGEASIHGGCEAFLVDVCTTLALTALQFETTGELYTGVSQTISVMYHSPASLGDKLRIVNTSITNTARTLTARTEIWNATHHRVVASGSQTKMRVREGKEDKPKL